MAAILEFCGETYALEASHPFSVGREADLVIDENQFLHRRFLEIAFDEGLWWLRNVGSQLTATLADDAGLVNVWLAPGASFPLVFPRMVIWFTAGRTAYELTFTSDVAPYVVTPREAAPLGATTTGRATLTPDQHLLLLGLTEPMLRGARGSASVPTSAQVAARLSWPITTFNRKLDSICQKLERLGVQGLHGGPDRLAANRKARLAEYAMSSRLVTVDDLVLLPSRAAG